MHELAVCQSMMDQVEAIAQQRDAQRVTTIVIGLGPLSGVEAKLLQNAYPIASTGTVAEHAELVIELLPVKVRCTKCGSESEALPNKLICKQCGDWQTTLLSGDEMLLISVELEKAEEGTAQEDAAQAVH